MNRSIPSGVYPTMITPYTKDNKIDYAAVEGILNWYGEKKVDGIFAICQSSEIFFLSFEERLELLRFVMDHRPKGVSIVASGHTADDPAQQIKEAQTFVSLGIDAYVFISNRFAAQDESDDVFLSRVETAAKALGDTPLGVYECPYPYKRLLTPDTLRRMTSVGNFRFLKDTCCDTQQIKAKLDAVKDTQLQIFNANAATLLDTLKLGCAGYSGVMANFHPEIYGWLCKNFATQPEKAQLVQDALGFLSVAECQCYPVNAKYHMNLEGVPMEIASRSGNAAAFTGSRALEIQQMHRLTGFLKEKLAID